jgi:hypothetical protein
MLSPTVARRPIHLVAGDGGAAERGEWARQRIATLSPREHEVALAVGRGCSNAEIAADPHTSVASKGPRLPPPGEAGRGQPRAGGAYRARGRYPSVASCTFAAGVASLVWMVLLTALIVHEKTQPSGR